MAVLVEVAVDEVAGGSVVLVEVDRQDIAGSLTLASPQPGQAAAKAVQSLAGSLEQLEPVLRTVKDKLVASAPEHFTVEFGVKLGGETGLILAKGTAEVNLKITMTWDRERQQSEAVGDDG
jgi:Trypsin-co-occurring domain 1